MVRLTDCWAGNKEAANRRAEARTGKRRRMKDSFNGIDARSRE
jgi:hypothetical protein